VRFDISTPLKAGTTYRINIVAFGGYSFSESAYLAVCNDFDLRKYEPDYSPSTGFSSALDIEIWHSKRV
jgi:hypothetical protein